MKLTAPITKLIAVALLAFTASAQAQQPKPPKAPQPPPNFRPLPPTAPVVDRPDLRQLNPEINHLLKEAQDLDRSALELAQKHREVSDEKNRAEIGRLMEELTAK